AKRRGSRSRPAPSSTSSRREAAAGASPRSGIPRRGSRISRTASSPARPARSALGARSAAPVASMYRIGIDVGGTFTDLVAADAEGRVTLAKAASTPEDQSLGVMEGLTLLAREHGMDLRGFLQATDLVVHGTT